MEQAVFCSDRDAGLAYMHLALSKLPWFYDLTNFPKTSNHIKFTT
ncbi:hypothetical protein L917_01819 [Phytophthora nicotianae]|uniref:Uncharacterized protein n=2 Tax=Phytophthora nicotianae TaxID=4792 RepID=V9FY27_PHYNI|nr:hypothetical protein F443_01981 [Phytophthora nicotianae P1569]ETM01614.1 hypothetical protein L917_01819 [Phytophthora nicotianae]ETM54844.1 hypothetical protein L914_01874 [Phytophthora nicotianae]